MPHGKVQNLIQMSFSISNSEKFWEKRVDSEAGSTSTQIKARPTGFFMLFAKLFKKQALESGFV